MNSYSAEETINRTKQDPPQRPQRRISVAEEVSHRLVYRSFFQDMLAAPRIFPEPLREQLVLRADAAGVASRPWSGEHCNDGHGGQKSQHSARTPCLKQPVLRWRDVYLVG